MGYYTAIDEGSFADVDLGLGLQGFGKARAQLLCIFRDRLAFLRNFMLPRETQTVNIKGQQERGKANALDYWEMMIR